MLNRIVLGIDSSDHAAKATDVTAELAKTLGSEVLVVHVLERIAASKGAPATDLELPRDAVRLLEETATRLKKKALRSRRRSLPHHQAGWYPRS